MTIYTVAVYVNVDPDFGFRELRPGQKIARVDDFIVEAPSPAKAASMMYAFGNKEVGPDSAGKWYPRDVRSISVGDLLVVSAPGAGTTCYAVASFGFTEIPEPANPIVALEGTFATSRPAVAS